MHCTLIFEDTLLTAHRLPLVSEQERRIDHELESPGDIWYVHIVDKFSGKDCLVQWTDAQFAAISALMHGMGEDADTPAEVTEYLYKIAEPAMASIPKECRPIP